MGKRIEEWIEEYKHSCKGQITLQEWQAEERET